MTSPGIRAIPHVLLGLLAPSLLGAQDSPTRPTGLPAKVSWTFNLEAGPGAFGFANSLFLDRRPDPSGGLSDNWSESFVKPDWYADWSLDDNFTVSIVAVLTRAMGYGLWAIGYRLWAMGYGALVLLAPHS